MKPEYTFEFLAWVQRAFCFRNNLHRQLEDLGAPLHIILCMTYADSLTKYPNIIRYYNEYCIQSDDIKVWFYIWLDDCYKKWAQL